MTKFAQVWTSEDICGNQGSATFIEHLLWTRHALDICFLLILRGESHICCFITQMRNGGSERVSRSSKSPQVVRYWDSTSGMTETAHPTFRPPISIARDRPGTNPSVTVRAGFVWSREILAPLPLSPLFLGTLIGVALSRQTSGLLNTVTLLKK